ncbi:hypothetical protein JQ607_18080 [Bradyrhizobium liaoningense]|uniref:hypothetical protein n=1 Tax=Bradyrhizobium liaoningense TaxID=43992 RepID=UPI001BAC78B6|nr:hypothetical protein [Bradyrhizobium liaoningense]MBR0842111.1 hypothetical protein [Bradyrhizobium liaoningense]
MARSRVSEGSSPNSLRKDTMIGGSGVDIMFGMNGNDSLTGNGGSDALLGGPNVDTLYGGGWTTAAGVNLNAHSVVWIESGGNTIVYANTSNAAEAQGNADMMIVLAGTNLGLTASNFLLHP